MDEIYYIFGIDARPWKKFPTLGAIIPLALFFTSVELYRQKLNNNAPLSNLSRYFVIISLVVLSLYGTQWLKRSWREEYTKRMLLNLIYLGLISTGIYNALTSSDNINQWLVFQEGRINEVASHLPFGDAMRDVVCTAVICLVGISYLWLQTWSHQRAEAKKLGNRPSSHIFCHFQARERLALKVVYTIYFFGSLCIVSFLVIA